MPTFEDIAIKAQQKTYILRDGAREAQTEQRKQLEEAQKQLGKELPVQLKDLQRYVNRVESLYRLLDRSEVKTLLMVLNGAQKWRIFSTNFAIGFFRGVGAMLGVALVVAIITLVVLNSPYQQDILEFLGQSY